MRAGALPPWIESPFGAALAVFVLSALAIGGAWYTQLVLGMQPCELCLLQRWPYYVGVPVAALAALSVRRAPRGRVGLMLLRLLAVIFLVSFWLGVFHAGVEWGFWPGPIACTGAYEPAPNMDDFLKSLQHAQVTRCDEAAMRVLGLSLAGWNAVVSLAMAIIAVLGARAARRGRVAAGRR